MTRAAAAAGVMKTLLVGPAVKPAPEKLSEIVPARLSARPAKVATPPETVLMLVPWSGPLPLASEAVIAVVLSVVSRLPY